MILVITTDITELKDVVMWVNIGAALKPSNSQEVITVDSLDRIKDLKPDEPLSIVGHGGKYEKGLEVNDGANGQISTIWGISNPYADGKSVKDNFEKTLVDYLPKDYVGNIRLMACEGRVAYTPFVLELTKQEKKAKCAVREWCQGAAYSHPDININQSMDKMKYTLNEDEENKLKELDDAVVNDAQSLTLIEGKRTALKSIAKSSIMTEDEKKKETQVVIKDLSNQICTSTSGTYKKIENLLKATQDDPAGSVASVEVK